MSPELVAIDRMRSNFTTSLREVAEEIKNRKQIVFVKEIKELKEEIELLKNTVQSQNQIIEDQQLIISLRPPISWSFINEWIAVKGYWKTTRWYAFQN